MIAQARLRVLAARKVLETVVPILGTDTDEGKDVLNALKSLSKFSGDTAAGLGQSELQSLSQAAQPVPRPAGPGGPGPGMMLGGPRPGPGSMGPGAPAPVPG